MTTPPHVRVGSVLRRQSDGRRFVVRAIHKATPHTGFSAVVAHEASPQPLEPRQQRKKKRRRNTRPSALFTNFDPGERSGE
jgi:hypothetical protein